MDANRAAWLIDPDIELSWMCAVTPLQLKCYWMLFSFLAIKINSTNNYTHHNCKRLIWKRSFVWNLWGIAGSTLMNTATNSFSVGGVDFFGWSLGLEKIHLCVSSFNCVRSNAFVLTWFCFWKNMEKFAQCLKCSWPNDLVSTNHHQWQQQHQEYKITTIIAITAEVHWMTIKMQLTNAQNKHTHT